ncbi:recombinase family protein [Vagococcus sp. BWB3-3]|uniref:Recombinase family protein n=1 Tax=Vagococcus allomyrinae TaxID=2794353 RepID=A0A940STW2_9ENTE|nr:recombinase family protein [Vagococcus allomyrinae]
MAIIGYARVSTTHQKLDTQLSAFDNYGVDYVYKEYDSGRKKNRPVLEEMLKHLTSGDTLVILKLDRLARGTQHLLKLLDFFETNDINFVSIDNHIDTSTPMGKLVFTIMGAFAEMEASLIRERVVAGIEVARQNGVQLGRPTKTDNIERALYLYEHTDQEISQIADECEITPPTLYRHLAKRSMALRR